MRELKGDWRDLLNCFMVALDLRKLVLAFIGGTLSLLVLGVDAYFLAGMRYHDYVRGSQSTFTQGSEFPFAGLVLKILLPALATIFSDPVLSIAYLVVVVLTVSVIWSYFGGAITRICAVEVAKDERIELQRSLEFVKGKYSAYFWSLAGSAIAFLVFFFINCLVGLLGNDWWLGFGNLMSILLMAIYPLALLSGFVMVMLGIGTFFGFPLYYPAISVEGTDMFDAISRGFSYVFSRPWQYAFYQILAFLLGSVSVGFVWSFGYCVIRLTEISGGMGMGTDRFEAIRGFALGSLSAEQMSTQLGTGGSLAVLSGFIYLIWMVVIVGFLAAYAISYFFSAQTMIYLLLRKRVDGIEMNEVFEDKTEEEPLFPLKAESTQQKAPTPAAKPVVPLPIVPGSTPPAGGGQGPAADGSAPKS